MAYEVLERALYYLVPESSKGFGYNAFTPIRIHREPDLFLVTHIDIQTADDWITLKPKRDNHREFRSEPIKVNEWGVLRKVKLSLIKYPYIYDDGEGGVLCSLVGLESCHDAKLVLPNVTLSGDKPF